MKAKTFKSDILLLITATIWGFAFVAQRIGMDFIGPFTFNGIRFALGALSILPLLLFIKYRLKSEMFSKDMSIGKVAIGGVLTGIALFMGASLQQVGLVYTTAGNAGFITGLYVVLVPIMSLFIRQRAGAGTWIGAFLAVGGLYLLSVKDGFSIAYGDLLEMGGTFFWAAHVMVIFVLSRKINPVLLSIIQFATCSLLSLIIALIFETTTVSGLQGAAFPILYGGIGSAGIAYTLQVIAQKEANPAHAAILLSLESVMAAFGGWLMLNETMSARGMAGCSLMLAGMLLSQLQSYIFIKK